MHTIQEISCKICVYPWVCVCVSFVRFCDRGYHTSARYHTCHLTSVFTRNKHCSESYDYSTSRQYMQ